MYKMFVESTQESCGLYRTVDLAVTEARMRFGIAVTSVTERADGSVLLEAQTWRSPYARLVLEKV